MVETGTVEYLENIFGKTLIVEARFVKSELFLFRDNNLIKRINNIKDNRR